MPKSYNFSDFEKQQIIDDYTINLMSYKEIMNKYNIRSHSFIQKILKDYVRSNSEANKLAHKKYPNAFKHSEETKEKIRQIRLKYMQEHPEATAWRQTNISYPEQQFEKFLREYGYANKYLIEREVSVFPYFVDFAFSDLKIAIEIDGSQHLEEKRKESDNKKDELLQQNGWIVIRISENVVKTDWKVIKETLDKYINLDSNTTFERVGIVKASKKSGYIKKKRNEFGLTERQLQYYKERNQKTLRDLPDKNVLLEQITNNSFEEVGRLYNVTGNAIKKWCKRLGLPSTKYELGRRVQGKLSDIQCKNCGKTFHPKDKNSKFCCRKCADEYQFKINKIGAVTKEQIVDLISQGLNRTEIAKTLNLSRPSFYKLLDRYELR